MKNILSSTAIVQNNSDDILNRIADDLGIGVERLEERLEMVGGADPLTACCVVNSSCKPD